MGALKQQFMMMQDQGVHVLDNDSDMIPEDMEERALNFLIREVGDSIDELLQLGLTRDDIEVKIQKIINEKSEERNR